MPLLAPPDTDPFSSGASTGRPLLVRRRQDLVVVAQNDGGGDYYVLKNPVDLQYHRLLAEEYFIWESL
ncbi:MAG: hypothetical protein J0M17_26665, partial [Planctomycetes bacterium]|nr:hypothetical protein [Planctomycetota bacterium]